MLWSPFGKGRRPCVQGKAVLTEIHLHIGNRQAVQHSNTGYQCMVRALDAHPISCEVSATSVLPISCGTVDTPPHAMPCQALCAGCLSLAARCTSGCLALQSFHSRTGRAYLFSAVVNLMSAEKEARLMTTGLHTVCDLYCNGCMQVVGWSYVS